jgi:nucleotidyltransferase substrate binding protein (TIGR01987 family)
MQNQDVRSKQRFQNFEKAFPFLQSAVSQETYTPIEVGGLVKAFEFTFELGWKTIKDFLYEQGIDTSYPREVIKEAFQTKIIEDGNTWITMLEKRNELSHTYNDTVAEKAIELIKNQYYPAIAQFYHFFKSKIDE